MRCRKYSRCATKWRCSWMERCWRRGPPKRSSAQPIPGLSSSSEGSRKGRSTSFERKNMRKANIDMVVGIFVLIGILCLAYLSIKLGKMELIGGNYYNVYADFDSVSGLKSGASVEIAGVEVGRVHSIVLDPES